MNISFGENITIRNVDGLRLALLDAFANSDEVLADASTLLEVDLSFVQVMEAARSHATQAGKSFRLTAPSNEALTALLHRGGFVAQASEADLDFWFHRGQTQ